MEESSKENSSDSSDTTSTAKAKICNFSYHNLLSLFFQ